MGMASLMTKSEMKKLGEITDGINAVLKKHNAELYGGILDCGHGDMEFRLRLFVGGCEYDITKDINNHDLTSVEPDTTASQPVNPECGAG